MKASPNENGLTVVIATYNRPDTLEVALRSVAMQTRAAAEILVVGDHCDERTGEAIQALDLPALRYINLPVRCGEQAIPNAVGTALARGRWIAYLNHDDVWAPDHLAASLDSLQQSGRRWHLGPAWFSGASAADGTPLLTDRTVHGRRAEQAFSKSALYLEPVSSWLVERSLALKIGNWRPAWRLRRTPTTDFALRLFRVTGEPSSLEPPRVVKLPSAVGGGERSYEGRSAAHAAVQGLMDRHGPHFMDHLRPAPGPAIDRDVAEGWGEPQPRFAIALHRWLKSQDRLGWYLRWGLDCPQISAALLGLRRGSKLQRALRGRTGEKRLARLDPQQVLALVAGAQSQ